MKILAMSLLRLGDVFLAAPALAGIKRKYPHAEIHGLVNRQTLPASGLIGEVDHWHVFERDLLQNALADVNSPILEPFFRLESLLEKLRAENYDLVLNFTHNRLSGWLCGAIEAGQTIGLALNGQGRPRFGSSWFQFLNDKAEDRGSENFHYSDIFWFGAGLNREPRQWRWQTTMRAKQEAQNIIKEKPKIIAMQPFTSETKKEWGTEHWCQTLKILKMQQAEHEYIILAAPSERERCDHFILALLEHNIVATPAICSLMTAVEILNQTELLITGDTSIKHLAAASPAQVIELSLGSSDWRRTGIYKDGAYIVQPQVDCAPCPHSSPCSQKAHHCGMTVAPDFMAKLVTAVLEKDHQAIEILAKNNARYVEIYKTGFSGGGYWQCLPLGRALDAHDLRQLLDKLTSKMLLQGEHLDLLGCYGTEAYRLGEWLQQQYPQLDIATWRRLIEGVESDNKNFQLTADDALKRLQSLVVESRKSSMVELKEMRHLQAKVEEISRRLEIRHRLVRSLKDVVEEAL